MTATDDPAVVRLSTDDLAGDDPWWLEETLTREARKLAKALPPRYATAVVEDSTVRDWVRDLVQACLAENPARPTLRSGPSLLIVGSTGTGKTHTAFGVVRALAVSGVATSWQFTTAADFYAEMRPRPGSDPEAVFRRYADAWLLVIDDLGAAKGTEWNEEVNYRLINHRYQENLPTLITSNVPPMLLSQALGERVASRLAEMATRVVLRGPDRRLGKDTGR